MSRRNQRCDTEDWGIYSRQTLHSRCTLGSLASGRMGVIYNSLRVQPRPGQSDKAPPRGSPADPSDGRCSRNCHRDGRRCQRYRSYFNNSTPRDDYADVSNRYLIMVCKILIASLGVLSASKRSLQPVTGTKPEILCIIFPKERPDASRTSWG